MPLSDLLNIRFTDDASQIADLYRAYMATGQEPYQARQQGGIPDGLARLAGTYTVDPLKDFGQSIHRARTGQTTPYDIANIGMNLIGTGATTAIGTGLKGQSKNVVSMFVSPSKKEVETAEKMLSAGFSQDEIHKSLLMHKKPDGFWRKEIGDSEIGLKKPEGFLPKYTYPEESLTHPEFKERFPQLWEELMMQVSVPARRRRGSFTPGSEGDDFTVGRSPEMEIVAPDIEAGKEIALHELQHAVQDKEGWASGGNVSQFRQEKDFHREKANVLKDALLVKQTASEENISIDDAVKLLKKEGYKIDTSAGYYADTMSEKNIFDTMREHDAFVVADPYESYRNLLGEREARDTASRMNLTLEQRRETLPDFGEGAIVRGGGGVSMSLPYNGISQKEMERRLKTAQKKAAKPIEDGGLGLPPDNTAMDRAAIMFPEEGYHGTNELFPYFDPENVDKSRVNDATGKLGVWISETPEVANEFAFRKGEQGAQVVPLRVRSAGKVGTLDIPPGIGNLEMAATLSNAQDAGYDLIKLNNYTSPKGLKQQKIKLARNPNQVRSRFAAFDPEKIDSSDIMAGLSWLVSLLGADALLDTNGNGDMN